MIRYRLITEFRRRHTHRYTRTSTRIAIVRACDDQVDTSKLECRLPARRAVNAAIREKLVLLVLTSRRTSYIYDNNLSDFIAAADANFEIAISLRFAFTSFARMATRSFSSRAQGQSCAARIFLIGTRDKENFTGLCFSCLEALAENNKKKKNSRCQGIVGEDWPRASSLAMIVRRPTLRLQSKRSMPGLPLIHRECGARVLSLPEVQRRKRETTLRALRGHDAGKHHQAHARDEMKKNNDKYRRFYETCCGYSLGQFVRARKRLPTLDTAFHDMILVPDDQATTIVVLIIPGSRRKRRRRFGFSDGNIYVGSRWRRFRRFGLSDGNIHVGATLRLSDFVLVYFTDRHLIIFII
ncbi:unnamed protein product [Trichogramma brassicae]|uniref:Uncharacterized protein n=1 Tax=Trichogramma brassicae TaxID=86971 RepID=A0A6H5HXY0_9HYME|nr:unnamed protein product [Trichogramma brassicae]